MEFDHHTLVMLMLRPDAPVQSPQSAQTLQDAHLAFIADQVAAGHILAAGPPVKIPRRRLQAGGPILQNRDK